MRFPVPSSLKASGSSFCGETVKIGFIVLAYKHYSLTEKLTLMQRSYPSEVKVRLVLTSNAIICNLQTQNYTVRRLLKKNYVYHSWIYNDSGIYWCNKEQWNKTSILKNTLPAALLQYPFPALWDPQFSGWSYQSLDLQSQWAKHWNNRRESRPIEKEGGMLYSAPVRHIVTH